jgi:hypothetical protein
MRSSRVVIRTIAAPATMLRPGAPRHAARRMEPAHPRSLIVREPRLRTAHAFGARPVFDPRGERGEVLLARIIGERGTQEAVLGGEHRERIAAQRAPGQVPVASSRARPDSALVEPCAQLLVGQVLHVSPLRIPMRALSSVRARDSRDITVPTGTPRVLAISSYDRSCTTRNVSTAWCSV